jgi:hypothetical protein
MDKEERNFLKGHFKGQDQVSRSKTLNFNKQRMDCYFLIKLATEIDKQKASVCKVTLRSRSIVKVKIIHFDN